MFHWKVNVLLNTHPEIPLYGYELSVYSQLHSASNKSLFHSFSFKIICNKNIMYTCNYRGRIDSTPIYYFCLIINK